MLTPQAIYDPTRVAPAYQLRYTWSGFPSGPQFSQTPVELLSTIEPLWEADGMRLLEQRWTPDVVQLLFSAKPHVSPVFLAARAKGRLDHALRVAGMGTTFSRKLSLRSIGENTREQVEKYIEQQVRKERFVDPRFTALMEKFTFVDPGVDLSLPTASASGRYWYNLHIVLVTEQRSRFVDEATLSTLRDGTLKVATKKGYGIARLSLMPDHLHVALRGTVTESPNEIVYALQNNLSYLLGQRPIWEETFYAGTFSEYDMGAVRASQLP